MFTLQPFAQQYWNSLYIAALVTIGTMLVAAMAGYAFARIRFPGANALFVLVLVGLLVPSEVTIVPLFRIVNTLGLINTHWPLIVIPILGAPAVLAVFIMRQFFLALPTELEEAGRIDGLGRWGIFWRIALPLARSALGAVAIFTFLKSWNLYLEPIVYLSSKESFTLPQALTQYVDAYGGRCGTSSWPRRHSPCCRSSPSSSWRRGSSSRGWLTAGSRAEHPVRVARAWFLARLFVCRGARERWTLCP